MRIMVDLLLYLAGIVILTSRIVSLGSVLLSAKTLCSIKNTGLWYQFVYSFLLVISILILLVVCFFINKAIKLLYYFNLEIIISEDFIIFSKNNGTASQWDKKNLQATPCSHGITLSFNNTNLKCKYWLPKSFFNSKDNYTKFNNLISKKQSDSDQTMKDGKACPEEKNPGTG
jgi:hypothetical protein